MSTVTKLGPKDHGRPMSFEEFMAGDYQEGYKYEIIHGRLYVSPLPNFGHDWLEQFVFGTLLDYSREHHEVINKVTNKSRVFVPGATNVTAPEPDIAAFRDFPVEKKSRVNWRDVSPVLVIEVMGGEDPEKDLVRNVDLYLQNPTIQEYWLFDIRDDAERPTLRVHRRENDGWDVTQWDADAVYTTDLLPGFELPVTPPE